jgi:death-on-curing protein
MPLFLSSEEVVDLHRSQIGAWGGQPGLRDPGGLESAVAAPLHHFIYGNGDLFDLAAALMFAMIANHPFVDGNKRTGTLAAAVMLELNGVDVIDEPAWLEALEAAAWRAARGACPREELAAVLRAGTREDESHG